MSPFTSFRSRHEDTSGNQARRSRSTPAETDSPTFLRIDVNGKRVTGPKTTTPIRYMDKNAEPVLIQGTELEFGWTMAIDTASGRVSSTLVDGLGVITLFGACTPHWSVLVRVAPGTDTPS